MTLDTSQVALAAFTPEVMAQVCVQIEADRMTYVGFVSDPNMDPTTKMFSMKELSRITTIKANMAFMVIAGQFGVESAAGLASALYAYASLDQCVDPDVRTDTWARVSASLIKVIADVNALSDARVSAVKHQFELAMSKAQREAQEEAEREHARTRGIVELEVARAKEAVKREAALTASSLEDVRAKVETTKQAAAQTSIMLARAQAEADQAKNVAEKLRQEVAETQVRLEAVKQAGKRTAMLEIEAELRRVEVEARQAEKKAAEAHELKLSKQAEQLEAQKKAEEAQAAAARAQEEASRRIAERERMEADHQKRTVLGRTWAFFTGKK